MSVTTLQPVKKMTLNKMKIKYLQVVTLIKK